MTIEFQKPKKAILFDLDGTLLDTTEGILESAVYAAKQMGYEALDKNTMLKFVGPPIQNSFMKFYGASKEEAQKAANIFRDYYKEKALFKAIAYPQIYELFDELQKRKVKLGVATYKREDYALMILEHFRFSGYCHSMHGADNFNKLTKTDIVEICIKELEVEKSEVVLIGDTEHDAIGAANAGIDFIGVTYGFGFSNEKDVNQHKNIGFAETAMDILELI